VRTNYLRHHIEGNPSHQNIDFIASLSFVLRSLSLEGRPLVSLTPFTLTIHHEAKQCVINSSNVSHLLCCPLIRRLSPHESSSTTGLVPYDRRPLLPSFADTVKANTNCVSQSLPSPNLHPFLSSSVTDMVARRYSLPLSDCLIVAPMSTLSTCRILRTSCYGECTRRDKIPTK